MAFDSFGQSAVFLLGGTEKSVIPTPMFIRNGDIVVMSGKVLRVAFKMNTVKLAITVHLLGSTRLNYHAVPRVIPNRKFNIDGNYRNILSTSRVSMIFKFQVGGQISCLKCA